MNRSTPRIDIERLQESDEKGKRRLSGWQRTFASIVAITLTLFTFYTAFAGEQLPMIQRGMHVYIILMLVFLWFPASPKSPKDRASELDILCVGFCLFSLIYLLLNSARYAARIPYSSPILYLDMIVAIGLVILCLEAGRRTLGISITIIALFFIMYAFFGPYFPGMFQYKGVDIGKFVEQIYMTTEGIFGSLTGISATTLFAFISFGAFLQGTGVDKYFMDFCLSLAGKASGGPAKVSCISSAMMGTISGSSIANVVTTGTLTIPIMKASGYTPEEAGAIETVASSGGQIMPPIMGTGAFILAEAVGVPYMQVVRVSILPALLYFSCLWFFIDMTAKKRDLKGMAVVPNLKASLKLAAPFFIPILILFALLVFNFAPFLGAIICTVMIFAISEVRAGTRKTLKELIKILESCSVNMASITAVILCASIVISMINLTGLMMKSTQIILSISGGSLIFTIILCAIVAYVLGMGLPITTCYVILSSLAAAALARMGVPLLNAHLMIFWFTQLAQITPPVCMTAFAGAAIAKGDPMKTGWTALTYGITFYIIPIMFIYSNLLSGSLIEVLFIGVATLAGLYFMVVAVEGFLIVKASIPVRFICMIIFIMTFVAAFHSTPAMYAVSLLIASITLAILVFVLQSQKKKRSIA